VTFDGRSQLKFTALLPSDDVAEHLRNGLISRQSHPIFSDLTIYNYTARAQYDKVWNEVTSTCRGLIVDAASGDVVARPFPKFFNLGEHELDALPLDQPFEVLDKMDGSLGILYCTPDGPAVATRGSFASEQAVHATSVFRNKYAHIPLIEGATYLFEIIFPSNRIVVDYGALDDLVLLAVIDIKTGADLPIPTDWPGPVAPRHLLADFAAVQSFVSDSQKSGTAAEGVVVRFDPTQPGTPSLRIKLKLADYVRLHRLITGVSTVNVWEALAGGQPIDQWLEHVPDEFYQWVRNTTDNLRAEYQSIEDDCRRAMADPRAASGNDRKTVAEYFAPFPHRAVLFKMFDGKPYESLIWKSIRPAFAKPMRSDPD
jgi:RNA ligase